MAKKRRIPFDQWPADQQASAISFVRWKYPGLTDELLQQALTPIQRRRGERTAYAVMGEYLEERRPTSQPLKVRLEVYVAIARVLSRAKSPLAVHEISESLQETTRIKPIEWQIRVVLRFLQKATPTILLRERSRYSAVSPMGFEKRADALWRAARA
jgi:hypothetical protein